MNWIFLRGLGRQSGHWFRFRELLEKERRARRSPFHGSLLFPDLPGTGLENHRASPATIQEITDDLRSRTVATLPPGQPHCLFAISLGGMVALDWLNRITHEGFRFFGIEIEVWRIGDSVAAPKFNLVA